MAKRLTTEAALTRVAELRAADACMADDFRPLLRHRSNHVIAKAVALAEELALAELAPELAEAFQYFLRDSIKRDPGCSAKLAIVNALSRMHEPGPEVFLAGVSHVQLEPAWGPPVDTAATMRALCGRALAAFGHPDAFRWLAVLMADAEPMTRALTVETLAGIPDERAELLLRAKIAREPDPRQPNNPNAEFREPERGIEMDAFDALMKIAPEDSFEFVEKYLDDADPDRVRAAALAIGGSHHADAYATLTRYWQRADNEGRALFALAIALVRTEEAFRFLAGELRTAGSPAADAIIEAAAIFREDPDRAEEIRSIVERRGDHFLTKLFKRHFKPPDLD